jgi:hypothetical protein
VEDQARPGAPIEAVHAIDVRDPERVSGEKHPPRHVERMDIRPFSEAQRRDRAGGGDPVVPNTASIDIPRLATTRVIWFLV